MPFIKDGKVRAVAVTTKERSPHLSDVETLAEAGIENYGVGVWYGVFTPSGTPDAGVKILDKALSVLPQQERFNQWANREGVVYKSTTPEELGKMVRDEELRWRELAEQQGIIEKK